MSLAPATAFDVPVAGGSLGVRRWGEGPKVVVAAHGIIGNQYSWQAVARALDPSISLFAPDLRGRGISSTLPPPFGMRAHATDLVAILDHLGLQQAVLAGHSLGAYVATTAATVNPDRWSAVILVEGGVPLRLPRGIDPEALFKGVLGLTLKRLTKTFTTRAEHNLFWREHPALADSGAWNDDTMAWLDHDLIGSTEPNLRSSTSLDAVGVDGRELLTSPEVRSAFLALSQRSVLLRAPRGLLNQIPPLLPDELLNPFRATWPIRLEMLVENTNHHSILFTPRGAKAIASHISASFG